MLNFGERVYFVKCNKRVQSGNGKYSQNYEQKDLNTEIGYVSEEGLGKPRRGRVAAQVLAGAME